LECLSADDKFQMLFLIFKMSEGLKSWRHCFEQQSMSTEAFTE